MEPYVGQFLVVTFAGWVSRSQQVAIEYLRVFDNDGFPFSLSFGTLRGASRAHFAPAAGSRAHPARIVVAASIRPATSYL